MRSQVFRVYAGLPKNVDQSRSRGQKAGQTRNTPLLLLCMLVCCSLSVCVYMRMCCWSSATQALCHRRWTFTPTCRHRQTKRNRQAEKDASQDHWCHSLKAWSNMCQHRKTLQRRRRRQHKRSSSCQYLAQCLMHAGTDRHFTKQLSIMHGINSQGRLHFFRPKMSTAVYMAQTDNTQSRRRRTMHVNIALANRLTHIQQNHRHM